jgi:hypothetical protein
MKLNIHANLHFHGNLLRSRDNLRPNFDVFILSTENTAFKCSNSGYLIAVFKSLHYS